MAFPPVDLGPLAFIGAVPLAIAFSRPGAAPTLWGIAGFGAAFMGLLIPWMRLFGTIAYIGLLVQQLFMIVGGFMLARGVVAKVGERGRLTLFPFVFLGVEYIRSHVPYGGFPWGGIGYSQHDFSYILEVAAYAGVWGVSLLVLGVNAAIADLLRSLRAPSRRTVAPVVVIAALFTTPLLLPVTNPNGESLRVAMVQGNTSEFVADPHVDDERVLINHIDLTQRIPEGSADLVVWPESSLGRDPFSYPEFLDGMTSSVKELGVPFLIGATIELPETEQFLNTILFVGSNGDLLDRYEKIRLVPFGEYVPFRRFLEPLVRELRRVPFDGVPGKELNVFALPQGKVATVICFESTFPGFVRKFVDRGAQFLVVSTNDSSFERSVASEQHLAFSQLRAAEHRIWVAHTALTGISAVVAPDGTILERTDLFQPALLLPEVQMATSKTFYGKTGDWAPALSMLAVGLTGLLSTFLSRRKSSRV